MKISPSPRALAVLLGAPILFSSLSFAAPSANKTGKTTTQNRGVAPALTELPPRMVEAIEARSGKKLTEAQKKNLLAAWKKHREEVRASRERFGKTFSGITGLSADEMRGMGRLRRGDGPRRGEGFGRGDDSRRGQRFGNRDGMMRP